MTYQKNYSLSSSLTKRVWPTKQCWYHSKALFSRQKLVIAGHSIMERWETNYMKMLASIAAKKGGDILEIGFGLGIAAQYIQKYTSVKSHTVIEFHPDVIKYFNKMSKEKSLNMTLIKGLWENINTTLPTSSFDGILFDTYPLSAKQNKDYHFSFFKEAYRILKPNGVLTYYSDESKNFSRKHIKKLKNAGFKNITWKICKVRPPNQCDYWNKKTILAPIIRK